MIIIICRFITYRAFNNTLLPEENKNRSNVRQCHFAAAVEAEEILHIPCVEQKVL